MTSPATRLAIPEARIRLDQMPHEGRDLELIVGPADRAEIAGLLGITALDRLELRLHAARFKGGIRVSGRLVATLVQPSVVSLEPVTQEIAEPVERIYLPGGERPRPGVTRQEVFVDLDAEDEPDRLEGNEADLSGFVLESLSLAIDPYPRAPGESLDETTLGGDTGDDLPFAGLRVLRTPPEEG